MEMPCLFNLSSLPEPGPLDDEVIGKVISHFPSAKQMQQD